ncbi:hypothetical protein ACFL6C_03095 [Myxococcota bacterium]
MANKTVLFVGLAGEQVANLPLPDGVEATTVSSSQDAVDHIALAPPDLIVANDRIGDLDSLDLFGQIVEADPESSTPVIFLAPPGSGVQPFLYQRRRVGFEVRYLDGDSELHTFFVNEPETDKAFTVKPIRIELLGEEIADTLSEAGDRRSEADSNWREQVWEIGFNQDIAGDTRYHVQTEVVDVEPIAVSSTVFSAGQALHAEQAKLEGEFSSLEEVRQQVESVHAAMVGRVAGGEFR